MSQRVIDEAGVPGLNRRDARARGVQESSGERPGRSLFPTGRHCRADGHLDTPAHRHRASPPPAGRLLVPCCFGQPDAWMLYVSCCGLSGNWDRRTGVCQIFIARIELHFSYPLSRPACGLGAVRLLAGLPTRITSRECLRIKIEQVEIVIRPLDDTSTTGSSKLDSGDPKGGARSAGVFCRASDHRHPRPARTEVSSPPSCHSQTPSDHLKIEGPMPFPLHGMAI